MEPSNLQTPLHVASDVVRSRILAAVNNSLVVPAVISILADSLCARFAEGVYKAAGDSISRLLKWERTRSRKMRAAAARGTLPFLHFCYRRLLVCSRGGIHSNFIRETVVSRVVLLDNGTIL